MFKGSSIYQMISQESYRGKQPLSFKFKDIYLKPSFKYLTKHHKSLKICKICVHILCVQ